MRLRTSILVVGLLAAGLVARTAPADAHVLTGGGVFTGTASFASLTWPVGPCLPAVLCPGQAGGWSLTGTGVGVAGSDTTPQTVGPLLEIDGSGVFGPGVGGTGAWCGWSSGSGDTHLAVHTPDWSSAYSRGQHWTQSAGTVLVATDGIPASMVTVVNLVPPVGQGGQSCLASAWTFTVVGAVVVAHV